ncbi:GNAT family N-acetyltransferase [Afifella pfennigii]|uniref:GNAT family N-acetyltransferase n=1 Tax=Afifella pfennigii TaxID=209897 RepID=UPI00047B8991|nr:GNAT family N-acetyltransferase [Afifella pfennigii]
MELKPPFRKARPEDAAALADFVAIAGEGLPVYLWSGMAEPGEDAMEVGRRRARREEGSFSYRNAVLREEGGKVAACLIGYRLTGEPEPIGPDVPPIFVPLLELENLALRTWYINVLATYRQHRGKGYGRELLAIADRLAEEAGAAGLSLIVSDANTGARRLYESCGFRELARRKMVKEGWRSEGDNWVLMVKAG